jgi:hypothetical protein
MLAHLALVGYLIPFDAEPVSGQVHEGHGGPGAPASFRARHLPWYASPVGMLTGQPLLLPAPFRLDGLPVSWQSPTESVLNEHGSLSTALDVPVATDVSGTAQITYTPRKEPADGVGSLQSDAAVLIATVPVRDLVTRHFQVPPTALGMLVGNRIATPASLIIEWHEAAWFVDQASGGGQVSGQKCGDPEGEWVVVGTYDLGGMVGSQLWVFTIGPDEKTGTFTYEQVAQGGPFGSPVTIFTEGKAGGDVTLTLNPDGYAHMHLIERTHTFTSWTADKRGKGTSKDVPVQESDLYWEPGGRC